MQTNKQNRLSENIGNDAITTHDSPSNNMLVHFTPVC